jgi:hypothetical protein
MKTTTLDALTKALESFSAETGLECQSADCMLVALSAIPNAQRGPRHAAHEQWLRGFITLWDLTQEIAR